MGSRNQLLLDLYKDNVNIASLERASLDTLYFDSICFLRVKKTSVPRNSFRLQGHCN